MGLEQEIINSYNKIVSQKTKSTDKIWSEKFVTNRGIAAAEVLYSYFKGGVAQKQENEGKVTAEWEKYFPDGVESSTKTPKTDIIVSKGLARISVKKGSARLISGRADQEGTATFFAALDKVGDFSKVLKIAAAALQDIKKPFVNLQTKTDVDKFLKNRRGKGGVLPKHIQASLEATKTSEKANQAIREAIIDNPKFKLAFVYEALSGEVKFGTKSNSFAEYALTYAGNNFHIHKLLDKTFLEIASANTTIGIAWKSSSTTATTAKYGKKYKWWAIINASMKELDNIAEECSNMISNGELLTEGIWDWIQDKWNKFTKWISDIIQEAYVWISQSFQNLFEFFDLVPIVR